MNRSGNKLITGFIIGIICPPIAFYIFCKLAFYDINVLDQLRSYIARNVLSHVISLSVIVNLPLFFGFLGTDKELTARGILGATILYAFVVIALKLF